MGLKQKYNLYLENGREAGMVIPLRKNVNRLFGFSMVFKSNQLNRLVSDSELNKIIVQFGLRKQRQSTLFDYL